MPPPWPSWPGTTALSRPRVSGRFVTDSSSSAMLLLREITRPSFVIVLNRKRCKSSVISSRKLARHEGAIGRQMNAKLQAGPALRRITFPSLAVPRSLLRCCSALARPQGNSAGSLRKISAGLFAAGPIRRAATDWAHGAPSRRRQRQDRAPMSRGHPHRDRPRRPRLDKALSYRCGTRRRSRP